MAILNNRLTTEQYEQNFSDIHPPFESREAALVEANRCLFCYDAPCTKSCPTSINIPKFIKQITTDNLKGSAYTILDANIMGGAVRKSVQSKSCAKAPVYIICSMNPPFRLPVSNVIRPKKPLRKSGPCFSESLL
ncbi:hypothetical protein [Spirosoma aerolatum]|uniref:hypothetical protein n=1 Tax=Spirosoma aerolatum TaxID=1211326 RepID=UPI001FE84997|nr:hypothetical protein [Spirosoma aerolatum]